MDIRGFPMRLRGREMAYFELAEHQKKASQLLDVVDCLGIFYEAGTGKTMCVLDHVYRNDYGKGSVLVIAPASVIPMWRRAIDRIEELFGYEAKSGLKREIGLSETILLASYGSIYSTTSVINPKTGRKKYNRVIKPEYRKEWKLIVIDESHCIGDPTSVQTRMCIKLAEHAEKRVIMTGTPVSGGGGQRGYSKIYSQLLFLDFNAWDGPVTWTSWKTRYCRELDRYNKPVSFDVAALDGKMQQYAIVARLRDCYDMPDTQDIVVDLTLDKSVAAHYANLKNRKLLSLPFEIDPMMTGSNFIKLYELTSGFVVDSKKAIHTYKSARAEALADIVSGTDDKVVIFCNFTHSVDEAYKVCARFGKTVIYDGRSKSKTWQDFQDGDAKYLITQYQAGGTGLDLYSSHTAVFYEPTLSALLLEQAKARTFRKGQNRKCLYYYLQHSHKIDAKILENVRNGVSVTTKMLDDWAKEIWGDKTQGD